MEEDAAFAKLPKSRSIWFIFLATGLLCFVFYYFYGGYLTMGIAFTVFLGKYYIIFKLIITFTCINKDLLNSNGYFVLILVIFYYAQDVLLYHPDLPANSRIDVNIPTMHRLPYETVSIRTPDKCLLHAYWITQHDDSVPTIVYFHGNAGNIGHCMSNASGIYNRLKCNILMVEYRGYGLSNGAPSEKGLFTDAKSAIDYLYTRNDLNHTRIVIFGRSLGGAVTIEIASDPVYSQKIMCAIVENTFTSIPDMAIKLIHPLVRFVPLILYKNKVGT